MDAAAVFAEQRPRLFGVAGGQGVEHRPGHETQDHGQRHAPAESRRAASGHHAGQDTKHAPE